MVNGFCFDKVGNQYRNFGFCYFDIGNKVCFFVQFQIDLWVFMMFFVCVVRGVGFNDKFCGQKIGSSGCDGCWIYLQDIGDINV